MYTSTLIKKLARLLEKEANTLLKPYDITHGYTYFLLELYQQDGLTQTELHQRIKIEQPTVVRTLDRMERDGLIVRKPSSNDRRVTHIYLTQKALLSRSNVLSCAEQLNQCLLRDLPQDECLNLDNVLQKLIKNLE
jgi:MarR family transcriptional regulator for hemolysin